MGVENQEDLVLATYRRQANAAERDSRSIPCLPLNPKEPEERGLWAEPGPLSGAATPPAHTVGVRVLSAPAQRQAILWRKQTVIFRKRVL